jgi:hypothetical protein
MTRRLGGSVDVSDQRRSATLLAARPRTRPPESRLGPSTNQNRRRDRTAPVVFRQGLLILVQATSYWLTATLLPFARLGVLGLPA